MLSRQTLILSVLKSRIAFSLPILMVFTYILVFFEASTVNSRNFFYHQYNIRVNCIRSFAFSKIENQIPISRDSSKKYFQVDIRRHLYAGVVAFETFCEIAGLMKAKNVFCFILFLNKIVQISVIIIQSEFILYTKTISFQSRPVKDKYFRAGCIFFNISVMNIFKCIVDVIVMGQKTDASFIQKQFYEDMSWDIINYTIFPINVFNRFFTSIDLYGLYRNTNIHS